MLAISAFQKRSLYTFDVPTAFTWAKIPAGDIVYLRMRKDVVNILLQLRPDYNNFTNADGSIYFKLQRALYGLVESALLWYLHISTTLSALQYKKLHFDQCIFIKSTPTSTNMVGMHVDDGFGSELSTTGATPLRDELFASLNRAYPGLKTSSGRELQYTKTRIVQDAKAGSITIDQVGYVDKLLLKHNVVRGATTPILHDSMKTREDDIFLDTAATSGYKSLVMELNHLAVHTRPDIALAVSIAATHMQKPTQQHKIALTRILFYLCHTREQRMLIQPQSLQLHMWIDASYSQHGDARSHTGMVAALGKTHGVVMTKSTKQKLVTQSSAAAELVALNSGVVYVQFLRGLLEELGCKQEPTTVYQDNKSTIMMAEKGSGSFKNSKHLNNRFFAIKEQIDEKTITLKHLGTQDMLIADGLTKPLPGQQFANFRYLLLG
jgi:hypothetical protein